MVNVSEQEEEALRLLDDGGDYGDVLEKYDNGSELIESLDEKNLLGSTDNGVKAGISGRARRYLSSSEDEDWENSFPGLNENEAWTLYGTLAGASRSDIADFLEVSKPAVSNYRNTLVDQNYLRNLQPGRGPSDYIPGGEMIGRLGAYNASPRLLEEVDPEHPLNDDDAIRWLIGEELYEKLHGESRDFENDLQGAERDTESQKTRSSSTDQEEASEEPGSSSADKSLQEIGAELLGDHEETLEQKEDQKRDFTDKEKSDEVDIEDDNAGYEGFT